MQILPVGTYISVLASHQGHTFEQKQAPKRSFFLQLSKTDQNVEIILIKHDIKWCKELYSYIYIYYIYIYPQLNDLGFHLPSADQSQLRLLATSVGLAEELISKYQGVGSGVQGMPRLLIRLSTSWWFQPIWKILVRLDHFPKQGWKYKIFETTN